MKPEHVELIEETTGFMFVDESENDPAHFIDFHDQGYINLSDFEKLIAAIEALIKEVK